MIELLFLVAFVSCVVVCTIKFKHIKQIKPDGHVDSSNDLLEPKLSVHESNILQSAIETICSRLTALELNKNRYGQTDENELIVHGSNILQSAIETICNRLKALESTKKTYGQTNENELFVHDSCISQSAKETICNRLIALESIKKGYGHNNENDGCRAPHTNPYSAVRLKKLETQLGEILEKIDKLKAYYKRLKCNDLIEKTADNKCCNLRPGCDYYYDEHWGNGWTVPPGAYYKNYSTLPTTTSEPPSPYLAPTQCPPPASPQTSAPLLPVALTPIPSVESEPDALTIKSPPPSSTLNPPITPLPSPQQATLPSSPPCPSPPRTTLLPSPTSPPPTTPQLQSVPRMAPIPPQSAKKIFYRVELIDNDDSQETVIAYK